MTLKALAGLSYLDVAISQKRENKKISRLKEKVSQARDDKKRAAAFRAEVWKRDDGTCRLCGRKVIRSLALVPNRGEVHHRKGRNVAPEDRYNVKQAVLLCAVCHGKAQRHEVKIPR